MIGGEPPFPGVTTLLFFSGPAMTLMTASRRSSMVMNRSSPAGGQQGRLVHQVLQVRTGEAAGGLGKLRQGDVVRQGLIAGVDLQNGLPPFDVGIPPRRPAGRTGRDAGGRDRGCPPGW